MLNITVWIHHKPETELNLNESNEITAESFKKYGKELKERMDKIAHIVSELKSRGFKPYGMLYDIGFNIPSDSEEGFEDFTKEEMEDYLEDFLSEEYLELISIEDYVE